VPVTGRGALVADGWRRYACHAMGSIKRWIALVALVIGALGLTAPASNASPKQDPIAVAACDVPPCTTPDNLIANAASTAAELLPLPSGAALTGTILVQPPQLKPPTEEEQAFAKLQTVLTSLPNPRVRAAKCFMIGISFLGYYVQPSVIPFGPNAGQTIPGYFSYHYDVADKELAVVFVAACLQMVLDIQNGQASHGALDVQNPLGPPTASGASAGCHQQTLEFGVKITRSGGRYLLHAYGTPVPPRGKSPLAISCHRTRTGLAISVRSSKRQQSLQKTFGKTLTIGFSNASKTPLPLHTSVTLR
jgi:hypothetical protein